jgi:CBS domain containing-hemolysin-like protein
LQASQLEVVERVLTLGEQRVNAIMTPRMEVEWIDLDDSLEDNLKVIKDSPFEQILVGRRSIDEPLGMVLKTDLLNQMLAGLKPDPAELIREPLILPESTSILRALDQFRKRPRPVLLALVVNEYGLLEGIVTPIHLLEALAGELPDAEGEGPHVVERSDGSYLIDGMMPAQEAFDFLEIRTRPQDWTYHTAAGFALSQLKRIPTEGDIFAWDGWRFEIVDMDGRRIDKMLVNKSKNV